MADNCAIGQLGRDISQLPQLLLSVCETVKDEALALIDNTRHMSQTVDMLEQEDSMETDCPRGLQKDQRDGVSDRTRVTSESVQKVSDFVSVFSSARPVVFLSLLRQVCVLALHLTKELCRSDEDGEHWVLVMRKVPVLPSVLSAVEISLRCKHNLFFTEAALHLLLTLARTPQVHTSTSLNLNTTFPRHRNLKERCFVRGQRLLLEQASFKPSACPC